jgi:UDP-3-O-[3-hydroxymyristoyl] glucosamine N-acyltransferase
VYERKTDSYYADEIARFLGRKLHGENCVILQPCSLENIRDSSVLFICKRVAGEGFDVGSLAGHSDLLVIVQRGFRSRLTCSYVVSPEPRLDFVRVLCHFFVKRPVPQVHPTAIVERGAVLGRDVLIGAHTYIGPEVQVGNNTMIFNNVVVTGRVEIGARCVIKSNATIGSEGFSFVTASRHLDHFPQIGRIVIGRNVWIGANTTIERAALDATTIGDDVRIDDLVQIGHNVSVGRAAQITAGAIICGRARIGPRVWIAPNACVDSAVAVGRGAFVGLGAVVLKDVKPSTVVAGSPARFLKHTKSLKSYQ